MQVKIIPLRGKVSYETIKHPLINFLFLTEMVLNYGYLHGFKYAIISKGLIYDSFINPFLKEVIVKEYRFDM